MAYTIVLCIDWWWVSFHFIHIARFPLTTKRNTPNKFGRELWFWFLGEMNMQFIQKWYRWKLSKRTSKFDHNGRETCRKPLTSYQSANYGMRKSNTVVLFSLMAWVSCYKLFFFQWKCFCWNKLHRFIELLHSFSSFLL